MKSQFVTYKIALKLKELGFDEECLYTVSLQKEGEIYNGHQMEWVRWNSFIPSINPDLGNCFIAAPLWQQVIDWFREKYNLFVDVEFFKLKQKDDEEDIEIWEYKINEKWTIGKDWFDYQYGFKHLTIQKGFQSFKEAREQAILKAIELCRKNK